MVDAFVLVGLIGLVCLLPPLSGWWLAARLRDDGLLRFTVACLAGVTTLAVAELVVYALHLPQGVAAALVAGTCAVSARPLVAAVRRREFAWDALLTWAGASAILMAAVSRYAVHGLSGLSDAYWDWYEHWLRALVFLTQGPVTTDFGTDLVPYIMPARGPLFNAAAALLLHLAGSAHYWVYQVFASTFNLLVCLPFAMLLRTVGGVSRRAALAIAALVVVLVPWYFWENTFTWTKDLTAAFVLLGTHEYLVAWREGRRDGMAWALAYLAPGFLCHYLVAPYAVLVGLHLVLVTPLGRLPIRALSGSALIWVALAGSWLGFMMGTFGVNRTLRANTTTGGYYGAKGGRRNPLPRVFAANLCADVLPVAACRPLFPPGRPASCFGVSVDASEVVGAAEPCPVGWVAEGPYFVWNGFYAVLGYAGLLAVAMVLASSVRPFRQRLHGDGPSEARGAGAGKDAGFLTWVLVAGLVVNLLPVNWFDVTGSYGENLQAWFLVLLAVLVRGLVRLPRGAIAVLVLAMAVEFGSADWHMIQGQSVVLPLPHHERAMQGHPPLGVFLPPPVAGARFHTPGNYYRNYVLKVRGGAVYFRDAHPESFAAVSWVMLALGLFAVGAAGAVRVGRR